MHPHLKLALATVAASAALDVILGILFGFADHISLWDGLYFATTTGTTVGYGDITPHGWVAHALAVTLMVVAIPLFGASFSLFTAGVASLRLERHERDHHGQDPR